MKKLTDIFLATILSTLAACSGPVGTPYQPMYVIAMNGDEVVDDAACTIMNSEGTWHVMTGQRIFILKSQGTLTIICRKEGLPAGMTTINSGCNNEAIMGARPKNNPYAVGGRLAYPINTFIKMGRRVKSGGVCLEND